MIFEKTTPFPALRSLRVRLSGRALSGREELKVVSNGLSFDGTALVLEEREGIEEVCSLPAGTETLYSTPKGSVYAYANDSLYRFTGEAFALLAATEKPRAIAEYLPVTGAEETFFVTESGAYRMTESGAEAVSFLAGGNTIAVHRERIFTAAGMRVKFTRALEIQSSDTGVQDGGYVDLPSDEGNILRLIPFADRLLVLRERGISTLRAFGDNMDFVAKSVPFCEEIFPSSAAVAENTLCFLSASGLCLFDGDRVTRAPIGDFSFGGDGGYAAGTYYAAIKDRAGERKLLIYREGEARVLPVRAELLAGNGTMLFAAGGKLCRLTERRALPFEEATLKTEFFAPGGTGAKYLVATAAEGCGRVKAYLTAETGKSVCVSCTAGKKRTLCAPLSGNSFSLRLVADSPDVCLTGFTLYLREESNGH